jgi:hypothetical protein
VEEQNGVEEKRVESNYLRGKIMQNLEMVSLEKLINMGKVEEGLSCRDIFFFKEKPLKKNL